MHICTHIPQTVTAERQRYQKPNTEEKVQPESIRVPEVSMIGVSTWQILQYLIKKKKKTWEGEAQEVLPLSEPERIANGFGMARLHNPMMTGSFCPPPLSTSVTFTWGMADLQHSSTHYSHPVSVSFMQVQPTTIVMNLSSATTLLKHSGDCHSWATIM